MDQEALDAINGSNISDSEMARLSAMVSEGPSMAPHVNADGSTSMRIAGVNVPMSAVAFVVVGIVVMIAAGR